MDKYPQIMFNLVVVILANIFSNVISSTYLLFVLNYHDKHTPFDKTVNCSWFLARLYKVQVELLYSLWRLRSR